MNTVWKPLLRSVAALSGLALALSASAETYLGLYLQGAKLGYSSYRQIPDVVDGKPGNRSESKTIMNVGLLGSALAVEIESTTWTDSAGKPRRMVYRQSSAGRTQTVQALFRNGKIECEVDNAGQKSRKSLPIPAGETVTDDPLNFLLLNAKPGSKSKVLVLDPTTVTLVSNEVVLKGPATTSVKGESHSATLVEVRDPRATMKVFFSAQGDLVKVDGPMGIEMIPESREEAMAKPDAYKPTPDLAFSTSLKTDRPIPNPSKATFLDMLVVGPDLSRVKSDDHQTVAREGEGWRVKVHPPRADASLGATVAEAGRLASAWTKPGLHVPSDSPRFRKLAAEIVGPRKRVMEIARAVQDHVYGLMKPNAGIGVLRDANDVLDTKEGVCRDYAILTATILRAAGVPTRVASGLVNWDGDFFYHAWVEVFNGKQWIGVDSTTPSPQISATHVKLASGSVEDAFTFPFLEKARLEIREVRPTR